MEAGITFGNTLHDLASLLNGRLSHRYRLETALQCRILFDMLAVFVKGGCTDHLNFSTGEGRLQDVGCVHRAFGVACAHKVVDLIDHQNDIAAGFDLGNEALHTAFKLASKLCTCHQCGQV